MSIRAAVALLRSWLFASLAAPLMARRTARRSLPWRVRCAFHLHLLLYPLVRRLAIRCSPCTAASHQLLPLLWHRYHLPESWLLAQA